MARRPLLLLTNDDGIDGAGLHVLARAMRRHGEVLVVAPDAKPDPWIDASMRYPLGSRKREPATSGPSPAWWEMA